MQKLLSRALISLAALLLFLPMAAHAACHVVTPSGSGTKSGADWGNALAGLPVNLVRGDTYYMSDGVYSPYTFTTSDSGTTLITIKKAIASDHCTDTGWNASTMGSGQAIFRPTGSGNFGVGMYLRSDYLVVDGQARSTISSGYGIKFDGSTCSGPYCYNLNIGDTGSVHDLTFRYVEIQGSGATDTANLAHPDQNVSFRNGYNLTLAYTYIHDSSGDPIEMVNGVHNITVDHSYIYNNDSTPINHGECIAANGAVSNFTISNSVLQDCEGTAFIDSLNSGSTATNDNWIIYNNVFLYSPNNANGRKGVGDGHICCANGNSCTNWKIYQNTFLNFGGGSASGTGGVLWVNGSTGTPDIRNNLFWNNVLGTAISVPSGSTVGYNSCLGPNDSGACSGTGAVNSTSNSPTPFVNWTFGDFHLASDNSLWNGGASLSIPYNADPDGTVRSSSSWDRGAFQFGSGVTAPAPPTNLTATVH